MAHQLALDFGTTNTVIARQQADSAEVLRLPALSTSASDSQPPLIPSLLYVADEIVIGQKVRERGLHQQQDNRLFQNFKRGIVADVPPRPRLIDGKEWTDFDAGGQFLQAILNSLEDIDELIVTAPVAAFQGYLDWLGTVIAGNDITAENVRVVDESTAAALGYAVTEPGATVLVFDLGGGTLDLSLVQLPETRQQTGGFLRRLLFGNANRHTGKVIAKAGKVIGGTDIDQWLLNEVLARLGFATADVGSDYTTLLTACEAGKIALSSVDATTLHFRQHRLTITRDELESLLQANGLFVALWRSVDKVMYAARQQGIFKEDIHHVLMVGGGSLMPSVQTMLKRYFTDTAVRADKPFTAVAEGALQVAAGYGLDDYLAHSYGLRHLTPGSETHDYDEILPMGSPVPSTEPIEVILGAAHANQEQLEFVIGELGTDATTMIEVAYENGQTVLVAQPTPILNTASPLNADRPLVVPLTPTEARYQDRLKATFRVDDRHRLHVTVTDLQTHRSLVEDVVIATLR